VWFHDQEIHKKFIDSISNGIKMITEEREGHIKY